MCVTSGAGCTLIELMANRGGRLSEQLCAIEVAVPLLTALAGLHSLGVVSASLMMLAVTGLGGCCYREQSASCLIVVKADAKC
jgi:hypothetical protein